uniref:RNA1 polyprotein n=1 Tax=Pearl millet nepovirus TaxID=3115773 RepID=A0AAT9JAN8_9SECO
MKLLDIDGNKVLPYGLLVRQRLCRYVLAKPANFACTFLAEGANLRPAAVAAAVMDGVIAIDTENFGFVSPMGRSLTWGVAAQIVRGYLKAYSRTAVRMWKKCAQACAQKKEQQQAERAAVLAAKRRAQASRLVKYFSGDGYRPKPSQKCRYDRALWAARFAANNAFIARMRAMRKQRQLVRAAEIARGVFPPRAVDVSTATRKMPEGTGECPVDGTLGAASLKGARYVRARCALVMLNEHARCLFPKWCEIAEEERHFFFELATLFDRAYVIMPCSSLIEDTLYALTTLDRKLALTEALKTATEIIQVLTGEKCAATQGLGTFMKKCGAYVKECVTSTVECIGDAFFEPMMRKIKEIFYQCIGQYLPNVVEIKAQIENFWQYAVKWTNNILQYLDIAIKALRGSALVAAAACIVGALSVFAESVLQSLGFLPAGTTGTLLCIFLGGVLTWSLGVEVQRTGIILQIRTTIINMISALLVKPRAAMHETLTAHSVGSVFGVPFTVVDALGSGLLQASANCLHYGSKWGAAVDNIRKGVTTMRSFLGDLMNQIALLYDQTTGRQTAFFRELSSIVYVDVEKWVRDTQEFLLMAEVLPEGDRVIVDTSQALLQKGNQIQAALCEHTPQTRGVSFNYATLVATLNRRLNDVYKVAQKCGKKALYRKTPMWIYIEGAPGCGKSLYTQHFVNSLATHLGTTSDNVYHKNARDAYWSKYRQQKIVVIDDLSAVETQPSLESEFINLVSNVPYSLNMAAVDEKGAEFGSEVIITTSNVYSAPTVAKILDMEAYNRRRHAVVHVRKRQGATYDPANPCAASEACLLDRHSQVSITPYMSMEEITETLLDMKDKFDIKQTQEYNAWRRSAGMSHMVYDALKDNLQRDAFVFSYPVTLMPVGLGDDPRKRYIIVDQNIVSFEPGTLGTLEKIPEVKVGEPKVDWESLEKHGEDWYPDFAAMIQSWNCNGMTRQFASQLLCGPSHVDSLQSLNPEALPSHKEFFQTLDITERAVLRLIQKRIDSAKQSPINKQCDEFLKRGIASYLKEAYDYVYANGGKIFLVFAAVILLFFMASSCMTLLRSVFIGGGAATMGAAMARMDVQSTVPSASDIQSYSSRNMRRVYRPSSMTLHSSGTEKCEDREHALNALVRITTSSGHIISAVRFKARSIALTYHQALTIEPGSSIAIAYTDNRGVAQTPLIHYWNPSESDGHLIRFKDTEICIYSHPQLSALPAALQSLFVKDTQMLPKMVHFKGSVVKLASESTQYMSNVADANEPILHMFTGTISLNSHAVVLDNYEWGGDYRYSLPQSWIGNYPCYKEDCGAILVAKVQDGYRIVGMHVGGTQHSNGSFTAVAALFPDWDCMVTAQSGPKVLNVEAGKSTPGVTKIGWIGPSDIPRAPRKTQYEWVEEDFRVPTTEEIKQPAILTGDDPRLGAENKGYDPLKNATDKCDNPMQELDAELLQEIADEMVEMWQDCSPHLSNLTDEEMINGNDTEEFVDAIVSSTSEGYPYILERQPGDKGKERYLEQDPNLPEGKKRLKSGTTVHRDMELLARSIYQEVPQLWCMEIPKDERLPKRKIDNPKTRTFTVLPMPFNLLLRKYTGRFMAFLQSNRHRLPCAVGINPYSNEWTRLYDRLANKSSHALNGDYASFDGLMNYQMYDIIARMINQCYRDDHTKARYNLIMAMYGRFSICGSQVYELRSGMPSGCAMTVIMNSIFNEILIRYVWKVSVVGIERNHFHHYVALVVYGDDNLIAIDPKFYQGTVTHYEGNTPHFINKFDGPTIQRELARVGVKITDGSDKTAKEFQQKPLQSLDFLKRGFIRAGDGRVYAPLDRCAIFSSLYTVIPEQGSTLLALFKNVHVALRELYLHQDEQLFFSVRSFFVEKGDDWRILPTWRECRDFHQKQYSNWQPWAPHKFMEVPLPATNKQFMLNQSTKSTLCIVADGVVVVSEGWRNPDPNKYYCIDLVSSSTRDANTLCVKPVYGEGEGQLPTQKWVDSFRSPKNPAFTTLCQMRKEGRIVAFKDRAPFITAWVVAISFCIGTGMMAEDIVPAYVNSGGQHPQMVNSYFEKRSFVALSRMTDRWRRAT